MSLPSEAKALVLKKGNKDIKPAYHSVVLEDVPVRQPNTDEVVVKVAAVGFNHRDLWIRKGLYPGWQLGTVLGSDAVGTVIASGKGKDDDLLDKRVFLVPMRGWESSPDGPETSKFGLLGGASFPKLGAFAEYITVSRDQVILAPPHLDNAHIAAWPVAGVTAWRAVSINADVKAGDTVLITGVGGGVALVALQLCLAKGARVYVTSGSDEKIERAKSIGASGGINYRNEKWGADLGKLLKGSMLDSIIDSGGGDIFTRAGKLLKAGGKLVCYGMTAQPKITFTMREVLKNVKLLGSTMGSRKDLIDATQFLSEHKIELIVSDVLEGWENVEKAFETIEKGSQFGKIVLTLQNSKQHRASKAHL